MRAQREKLLHPIITVTWLFFHLTLLLEVYAYLFSFLV